MSLRSMWRPRVFAPGVLLLLAPGTAVWAQSLPAANPLAAQSLEALSASRERPLFVPSRRPPAPAPVKIVRRSEAPPSPPPAPNVVLLGIISDADGEGTRAVVRLGADKPLRLRIGEEVAGWKVASIEERRLILTLAERSAEFTLFNDAHPNRAAPTAQAAVAPDLRTQSRSGR
jgi:general secretion pathway protein N